MVAGIVGPAGFLLDDDPFGISRVTAYFRIHIVLAIATARQSSFPILKHPAADITWEGFALMLLNCLQQAFGFLQGVPCGAMQLSIERLRGIVKRWPCGQIGWDRGRRHGRFRRRTGIGGNCGPAEQ